jgi:hypothetical protein
VEVLRVPSRHMSTDDEPAEKRTRRQPGDKLPRDKPEWSRGVGGGPSRVRRRSRAAEKAKKAAKLSAYGLPEGRQIGAFPAEVPPESHHSRTVHRARERGGRGTPRAPHGLPVFGVAEAPEPRRRRGLPPAVRPRSAWWRERLPGQPPQMFRINLSGHTTRRGSTIDIIYYYIVNIYFIYSTDSSRLLVACPKRGEPGSRRHLQEFLEGNSTRIDFRDITPSS